MKLPDSFPNKIQHFRFILFNNSKATKSKQQGKYQMNYDTKDRVFGNLNAAKMKVKKEIVADLKPRKKAQSECLVLINGLFTF